MTNIKKHNFLRLQAYEGILNFYNQSFPVARIRPERETGSEGNWDIIQTYLVIETRAVIYRNKT